MTHDPNDTHIDKDAFWAAYKALQEHGVSLAQVRAETSNRIAVAVFERRTQHGLGFMLELAQSSQSRLPLVDQLLLDTADVYSSVTRKAVDAAVASAAFVLSGNAIS